MRICISTLWLAFIIQLFGHASLAQESNTNNIKRGSIDSLIHLDQLQLARAALKQQLDFYWESKKYDSLPNYVKVVASYRLADNNWDLALAKGEQFVSKLLSLNDDLLSKNAYLELANLYDDHGKPSKAYELTLKALGFAEKIEDPKKADLEGIYYDLGTKAFNMGDIALSKKHQLKNLALRKRSKDQDHEMNYLTYNTMGRLMWYSGQPDSSLYYFKASLVSIEKLDKTPKNRFYRPAVVTSNMAALLHGMGEVGQAISLSVNALGQLDQYDKMVTNEAEKLNALKQKFLSLDNLGGYYGSMGEFNLAERFLEYSYQQKKKVLEGNDINISISMILIGQEKTNLRKFSEAKKILQEAIDNLNQIPSPNLYYLAYAHSSLGSVHEAMGEPIEAAKNFEMSEELFRKTMNGDYTKDFLDELSDMALFYSKIGNESKAVALSQEAMDFVQNGALSNGLQGYLQMLNRAMVSYNLKQYRLAEEQARLGLEFFEKNLNPVSKEDSIQIQFRKPENLLLWAKSAYALESKKEPAFYLTLLQSMKACFNILNQRKAILSSYADISTLMKESDEVFQFTKKLYYELYALTDDTKYLNAMISMNESSIYTRIRDRMNIHEMSFANVPEPVIKREEQLKKKLRSSLKEINLKGTDQFFKANNSRNIFLDSLKTAYPEYYQMRYALLEESLPDLSKSIPKATTLIRYLFIDDHLYAYVVDSNTTHLKKLDYDGTQNRIRELSDYDNLSIKSDISGEGFSKKASKSLEAHSQGPWKKASPRAISSCPKKVLTCYLHISAQHFGNRASVFLYRMSYRLWSSNRF